MSLAGQLAFIAGQQQRQIELMRERAKPRSIEEVAETGAKLANANPKRAANPIEEKLWAAARRAFPRTEDQAKFVALAMQESGFNPSAHNTKGEDSYGLFQFGPDMRRAYGMEIGASADAQITAGTDYIQKLYAKHAGNWTDVLAEHNLGLPRFQRMKAGQTDAAIERFRASHLPSVERLAQQFGAKASPEETAPTAPTVPIASARQSLPVGFGGMRTAAPQRAQLPLSSLVSAMEIMGLRVPPLVSMMARFGR